MPPEFIRLGINDFNRLVAQFEFRREIDVVHMHHAWSPGMPEWNGEATIMAMWRRHTERNGWSDMAQHVTIAPDGGIWTGRSWNVPPVSAKGFNGNSAYGPFMFQTVGSAEDGKAVLKDAQREALLGAIQAIQARFKLPHTAVRFQIEMSTRSCPGNGIDKARLLEDLARHRPAGSDGPPPNDDARPYPDHAYLTTRALRVLGSGPEPTAREEECDCGQEYPRASHASESESSRGRVSAEPWAALRGHVVNLSQGKLSSGGDYRSTAEDVEMIFTELLPQWLKDCEASGNPIPQRVLLYAHGGLVPEKSALEAAAHQLPWWRANGIYPIFFVWETGLFETLGQLLRPDGSARGLDTVTDPIIAAMARGLGGPRIWGGMKYSARRASDPDGGAHLVARRVADLLGKYEKLEVHAVGHSAGSIFFAHFLETFRGTKSKRALKSLQLLAPAIRVDQALASYAPQGTLAGCEHLRVFTMKKQVELSDSCGPYRKSLLYLIHDALEAEEKAPIFGLEESVRANPEAARLLGLNTPNSAVIWSTSDDPEGLRSSGATSHGGFDEDGPTLESVARYIIGAGSNTTLVPFPKSRSSRAPDWPDWGDVGTAAADSSRPADGPGWTSAGPGFNPGVEGAVSGRRRAVCVGIDQYGGGAALQGCVADARTWGNALAGLGFEVSTVLDQQATRQGIVAALDLLVSSARPGDVLVFQYAGHGTSIPDLDSDEADGTDEALCPIDYSQGRLLLDDDLGAAIDKLPQGVHFSLFMDCCHSGTISRFGAGPLGGVPAGARARYLRPTDELRTAHRLFRQSLPPTRALAQSRAGASKREILFSACSPTELAYEVDGNGAFTVQAARILALTKGQITNADFMARVVAAFGPAPRQNPEMTCNDTNRVAPMFGGARAPAEPPAAAPQATSTAAGAELARLLRAAANVVERG